MFTKPSEKVVRRLLFVVALAIGGNAMAEQTTYDHLIPARNASVVTHNPLLPRPHLEYMVAVYCAVDLGVDSTIVIREGRKGKSVLEFRQLHGSLLVHPDASKHVRITETEISSHLARTIDKAIRRMVREAREPEVEPIQKRDGSTFFFIIFDREGASQSARAVAPAPSSRPAKLVRLAGILEVLSRGPNAKLEEEAMNIAVDVAGP